MPRLVAIGDIHGCSAALRTLLDAIGPVEGDQIVALGDYVDRGPDSRGVIDTLIELDGAGLLVPILGNHDEMMFTALRGSSPVGWWRQHGGDQTLRSYGFAGDPAVVPESHYEFYDRCVPYFEADGVFFTHANYVADEPLDKQPAEALRWQSLDDHFPGPHCSGKRAILGHTAQKSGQILDATHLMCVDTHCHGGGWLTAVDVVNDEIWQASKDGQLRAD